MAEILFDDQTIETIKSIIEDNENCEIDVQRGIREVWFTNSTRETELRLLSLQNIQVTVSRVSFVNKRRGTMTKIAEVLEDFCIKNKIWRILVQSVETPEMSRWCFKNGFLPIASSSFEFEGTTLGDHAKTMSEFSA